MKIPRLFKILNLIALLFILTFSAFAQNNFFKPDAQRDSVWVSRSLININQQEITNKDTNRVTHKWVGGKVLYCADGSLKATQLIAAPDTFSTTIQYFYQGKIIQQRFNYTDLSNYTINKIYRLPDKKPAYLFLLSKTENEPDYEQDWLADFNKATNPPNDTNLKDIKKLTYIALVLRMQKDSLLEVAFPPSTTDDNDTATAYTDRADSVSTTTLADTNSFGFTSYIKHTGKSLKPFLKYDALTYKLSFLDVSCKHEEDNGDCTQPVLSVESGVYQYRDTSFVLATDTTYYYPSLAELDTTVEHRNYKARKYVIRAKAVEGYEEGYGGYFYSTLTKTYKIGMQTLTSFNNEGWEKIDLKPDYRLQKNASLILLLEDETNGHGPGMCGSASHLDSYFWLVDGKSSKKIFTFSSGSCNSDISYSFTRNGKEIEGQFYITDPADKNYFELDNCYWGNNSTYVFVFSDSKTLLLRNFYLHFNVSDKKNPVRLKSGKPYKKKNTTSK
ncbi:MAG: hypothetical protein JWR67_1086 [Mucilaginibacter sp.]|nr:hypothetical protein [Mucilaginibacter sp.]